MKAWMTCGMIVAAMAVQAQEGLPREPTGDSDAEWAAYFAAEKRHYDAITQPLICADLSATPTPLPNGDMQYPTKPCTPINLEIPPEPAAMPQARLVQPTGLERTGSPVAPAQMRAMAQPEAAGQDLNALQMKRLGQLDAMQGRPINMQNANSLGYLQGYTDGQKTRMQAPGGGFGGYNR